MSDLMDRARAWRAFDPDPETNAQLGGLIESGDERGIAELFAGPLQFGTAGIRGILGPGESRMNRVVVAQVTAGLADYLLEDDNANADRGVVIGYDGRKNSRVFAEDAARVLLARGLRVYLADRTWPTPTTAFAVRDLNACAGVMVTASHNPPDYNGYKVYWKNGAQIIPPIDQGIHAAIVSVDPGAVQRAELTDGKHPRLTMIGQELHERYCDGVLSLRVHPEASAQKMIIAYTPLHGVGADTVEKVLAKAGYSEVHTVAEQREPDGAFPTVAFPNPEEPGAMDAVIALAKKVSADLVVANDPDTDRLAIAIPAGDSYEMLTGDEVGVLLAQYLLEAGPKDARLVANTVVSSQLLGVIAEAMGVNYEQTLTGFKWIANTAIDHKAAHNSRLVVGYEEALGYSVGELVRDKDGVSAALLFCELAAGALARGETVRTVINNLYRKYGLFITKQVSLTLPGADGIAEIAALMRASRSAPCQEIAGIEVTEYRDFETDTRGLPPSDLLRFRLRDGSRVLLRPSGTEPKLKSYYEIREEVLDGDEIEPTRVRGIARLEALVQAHQALLQRMRDAL